MNSLYSPLALPSSGKLTLFLTRVSTPFAFPELVSSDVFTFASSLSLKLSDAISSFVDLLVDVNALRST